MIESNLTDQNLGKKKIKLDFKESKYATGRRKKSIARIWLKKGTGKIYVNGLVMNNYFKRSHCTSQESIFENTYQVKPGHYIEIDSSLAFKEKEYWKYIKRNVSNNSILNKDENINYLDKQLNKTIKNHLVSDVPVGAFLSGGIDSSLVVSIMQNNRIDKIKTFSIGFENKDYDETINSDAVAKFLKTDHNKIILNNKDVLNIVEDLPYIYDEPFADSSQIPTILVSQLASKYVKVSLSGDGGDEVFAGYNRYTFANKIKLFMNIFPFKSRIFVSKLLKILSVEQIDRIIKEGDKNLLLSIIDNNNRRRYLGVKLN